MKKGIGIAIAFGCLITALGTAVGVTLASGYKSPSESKSFQFGSITASDHNFQDVAYYFGDGSGTSVSPYLINNSSHLRNLSKLQNLGLLPDGLHFKVGTSFQYEGSTPMRPIGTASAPFTGTFDGDGHTIAGLLVSGNSTDVNVGLFGRVGKDGNNGTVKNLVLSYPSITATSSESGGYIGFAVGYLSASSTCSHVGVYGGTDSLTTIRAKLINSSSAAYNTYGVIGNGSGTSCGFLASLSNAVYASEDSWTTWDVASLGSKSLSASTTKSLYNDGGTVTGW